MKKSLIAKIAALGLTAVAVSGTTAAYADDLRYFNDGNGTCGYASCGAYGCAILWTEPCPREVSGD